MLFSSITFLLFFLPCTLILYYALPQRKYRNFLLLFASLLFYSWGEPKFVLLMIASIILNYNAGLRISSYKYGGGGAEKNSKKILIFAVILNIGILFLFKYLGFSCRIVNFVLKELRINHEIKFNVLLPLGISFYTFQEISYIVDVYKNPDNVQKNIFELGLYIAFFPQLIAGPIVRYNDINVQIETRNESLEKFYYGTKRFIIGLSKKVLLANNFARTCDSIYDADFFCIGTLNAWIAAFSYSLQIYYDFSGYSDMAIGLASMFGFDLQENFNYPYSAISITDFWKRWHISLTSFFRDYIYIPLGGNRNGTKNTFFNRFVVFFLTGLWHGASINFILWGMLHGALMSIERILKLDKKKTGISSFLYRFLTLIVILFLWVLFRNGTKQSVKLWLIMFGINYTSFKSFCPIQPTPLWFNVDTKIIIIAFTGIIFSFPWWKKIIIRATTKNTNLFNILEVVILTVLLGLCFAYLAGNAYNPFIYFRF